MSAAGDAGHASSGEAGAAGAPDEPPQLRSGTKVCEIDRDCEGLTCMTMAGTEQAACVQHCSMTEPCSEDEVCVEHDGITPSCLPRCEWPWDCAYEFDCIRAVEGGDYVCVLAPWTTGW